MTAAVLRKTFVKIIRYSGFCHKAYENERLWGSVMKNSKTQKKLLEIIYLKKYCAQGQVLNGIL